MRKFESFLTNYKNSLSFFGIIIALGVLIYSGFNTHLTYKALKFELKEYNEKTTPLFNFSIIRTQNRINNEKISIKPVNHDIALNKAFFYFIHEDIKDTFEVLEPKKFNIKDFKEKLTKELKSFYCDDCFSYTEYTCVPIAIRFQYFQYGERKNLSGLFKLTCKIYFNASEFKISFRNIELLKYYNADNKSFIWEDIMLQSYDNCYKNSVRHLYIDNKKIEILLKDKAYKSAYQLVQLLNEYYNYKIVYKPADSSRLYSFNYFLSDDSKKSDYNSLIKQSEITYQKLKSRNINTGNHYKKLTDYLQTIETPTTSNIDKIISSKWVEKEVNDSITILRENLRTSLLDSVKYKPND